MNDIKLDNDNPTIYTIQTNDKTEHLYSIHGIDFLLSLWDLDQWLRGEIKYNAEGKPSEEIDAYDKVRDQLREIMNNHNVNLEMLV